MIPSVKYLDIGGGLGIVYEKEKPQTAAEFANAVLPLLKNLGLTIILEPGRFIAGNAGILVTQVQYIKQSQYKNFIIVDSGMNDLIRPSLYSAHHEIVPVTRNKGKTISADIVGPICESGDFFALNRKIETLKQGDLLAIMGAGAYGFSMSSNYNSRRRAVEVLVNKNKFSIIRTRETYEDIIKNEKY
jgi:diaminopimelate decarboxylase